MPDRLTDAHMEAAMAAEWLRGYDAEPDEAIPLIDAKGDPTADGFAEGFEAAWRVLAALSREDEGLREAQELCAHDWPEGAEEGDQCFCGARRLDLPPVASREAGEIDQRRVIDAAREACPDQAMWEAHSDDLIDTAREIIRGYLSSPVASREDEGLREAAWEFIAAKDAFDAGAGIEARRSRGRLYIAEDKLRQALAASPVASREDEAADG